MTSLGQARRPHRRPGPGSDARSRRRASAPPPPTTAPPDRPARTAAHHPDRGSPGPTHRHDPPRCHHASTPARTTRTDHTPRPATGPAGSPGPTTRDRCPSTPPAPTDPAPPTPTSAAHSARRTNRANSATPATAARTRRPHHDPPHPHQPRATPPGCLADPPSCSPPPKRDNRSEQSRRNRPQPVPTNLEKGCHSGRVIRRYAAVRRAVAP